MEQDIIASELKKLVFADKTFIHPQKISPDEIQNCTCNHYQLSCGSCKEIHFDGCHIRYLKLSMTDGIEFPFNNSLNHLQMKFVLSGCMTLKECKLRNLELKLNSNQHNIVYLNKSEFSINYSGHDFRFFSVAIGPDMFKKYLHFNNTTLESFREKISSGSTSLICDHNCPIRFEMFQIIDAIINCKKKGILKKMFYEAKVIELLMLQFEQVFSCNFAVNRLKKADLKKIFKVRNHLQANLDKTITLKELARLAGTNESTLKKGFKEVFGKTVFSYWSDLKMEEAARLLSESSLNISEIAFLLGFKYPQHFTAAFKRKFGVPPSKFK